jgi:hypothetical protein
MGQTPGWSSSIRVDVKKTFKSKLTLISLARVKRSTPRVEVQAVRTLKDVRSFSGSVLSEWRSLADLPNIVLMMTFDKY